MENSRFYNDFPILNDETYSLMSSAFSRQFKNRNDFLKQIFSSLNHIYNMCLIKGKNLNKKICESLNDANKELEKLIYNFKSTFSLNIDCIEIKEFNLFAFLKEIFNTLNLIFEWIKIEEKEYYKTFAINSAKSLSTIGSTLSTAIANSNIIFFKHM